MVNQLDRHIVNNHIHPMRIKYNIIIITLLIDAEILLKAGTAATKHRNSEEAALRLVTQHVRNAFCG